MHRITARILDVSNAFQNTNVPINERFCVSPPPYYLDWFERSYPNIFINWYNAPCFIQFMTGIQGEKTSGKQCSILLYEVVKIIKYK